MADQDRFILHLRGNGTQATPLGYIDYGAILRQSQLDFSNFNFNWVDPNNPADGRITFDITADDIFQGNGADLNTAKNQIDAVLAQVFLPNTYGSAIQSDSRIIPAHQVATNINPNTGQAAITSVPPKSPASPDNRNWFDRTFFTGAGALTGTAIGILAVVGVVIVTQRNK